MADKGDFFVDEILSSEAEGYKQKHIAGHVDAGSTSLNERVIAFRKHCIGLEDIVIPKKEDATEPPIFKGSISIPQAWSFPFDIGDTRARRYFDNVKRIPRKVKKRVQKKLNISRITRKKSTEYGYLEAPIWQKET